MALLVLAVAQMGIHLVFFLHITTAPDNTNNVLALAFGVLIVCLIVFGSLWVMEPYEPQHGADAAVDADATLTSLVRSLDNFPITTKWPARHPDRIQLYSLPTPNGVKVSIMLEETGLPYEPHLVRFETNDQLSPEFLSLNPNNKIPAIIDPNGPAAASRCRCSNPAPSWFISRTRPAASCRRMPPDDTRRCSGSCSRWARVGPMFGQVGFFHKFAGKDYEDKRPRDRYVAEAEGLLGVLDRRLADRTLAHGRGLHDRRHRDLPLGQQFNRFLRRSGARERSANSRTSHAL